MQKLTCDPMAISLLRMVSPLVELGSCEIDHCIHIILALLLIIFSIPLLFLIIFPCMHLIIKGRQVHLGG